jgi:hypothetical protein
MPTEPSDSSRARRLPLQTIAVDPDQNRATESAPEWLVTNGLGGYAGGTMTGLVTRRFHGGATP